MEGKYDFDLHFILQGKGAESGDHIVRARGAWFGNRSISAEVDLEAGIYEVIPKIEASRDADAPDVGDVVIKLAERNPQKLRQIGLNYDIANAKGFIELSEEEKKKKAQKKKEAEDKKKKEKEAEEKEKADFEDWKREEKEEYEAWKREKQRREKKEADAEATKSEPKTTETKSEEMRTDDAKKDEKKTEATGTEAKSEKAEDAEKADAATPVADSISKEENDKIAVSTDSTKPTDASAAPATETDIAIRPKDTTPSEEPTKDPASDAKPSEPTIQIDTASDHDAGNNTPTSDDNDEEGPSTHPDPPRGPPSVAGGYQHPPPGRYQHSVYGDVPPPPPPQNGPADNTPKPWNAVCVLGLRVYSQDPQVSIKLMRPRDVEEGAILDVGGETAAGATM